MIGPSPGWGAVVQAGMRSLAVVKYFDIFGHGHACPEPGSKDMLVVHLVFRLAKNVSATALSQHTPVRPIDWSIPASVQ